MSPLSRPKALDKLFQCFSASGIDLIHSSLSVRICQASASMDEKAKKG